MNHQTMTIIVNSLKKTDFKDDIDEYYRLSCINLMIKGYNV